MTKAEGKLRLAERARCQERIAGLYAQLALETARLAELDRAAASGEPVDVGTGRKIRTEPEPYIAPPNDITRAKARKLLRDHQQAGKVRR